MGKNICKLQEEILKKNLLLNSIERSDDCDTEKVKSLKLELDVLLYKYYKRLKCG